MIEPSLLALIVVGIFALGFWSGWWTQSANTTKAWQRAEYWKNEYDRLYDRHIESIEEFEVLKASHGEVSKTAKLFKDRYYHLFEETSAKVTQESRKPRQKAYQRLQELQSTDDFVEGDEQ